MFLQILFLTSIYNCEGQDLHFSQFLATPLYINPSMTALVGADCRAVGVYRSQWREVSIPFNSIFASYEHKLFIGKNTAGIGIMIANDQSGDAQYSINDIRLSMAYHWRVENNVLSVGVQPGFYQKMIGVSDLTYPVQYDPSIGQFNSSLSNFENGQVMEVKYMDINLGLHWAGMIDEKKAYRLGLSLMHLFQPYESFYNVKDWKLSRKLNLNAGFEMSLNEQLTIFPNTIIMLQGGAFEFIGGANALLYNNDKSIKMIPGIHYRYGDAIIPSFSMLFKQVQIGLSYDLNVSGLKAATNYQGGFEVSLMYRCFNSQIDQMKVPCERF